jgi:uncharacterized membrane protein YfhO
MPIYEDNDGTLYSRKIHKFTYNKLVRSGFLFAVSSLVAVCLVAFAIIPTYYCLKSCSATSGSFPTKAAIYNNVFNFLANHLASVEPTIRSSGDTVLPNVYCGILTIILVPLYLFCGKISFKERVAHVALLAVFFVGFNLNYANYIFHAFHFPNDLPFRFSFLYSFTLIIMAYKALTYIKDISAKGIVGAGVGIIFFAILVQRLGMDNVSDKAVYISIGFAAVYTIVLGLMRKKEYAQSAVALLLMCCVFAEAAVSDTDHFQISQVKSNFTNGYTSFRSLKDSLDETEGTDKYRLELTNINTLMDASWFNYNGISVFSSMAYEASANLQNQLGLDSNYINSYVYHPQTPVYNCMMSLKYLINNDSSNLNTELYKFTASCGKFAAYKNNYYLPLGYAVNKDVMNFEITDSNPFNIQSNFWQYATGLSGVFNQFSASSYDLNNIGQGGTDFTSNTFSFYKENKDSDATITLYYVVPQSENVYFYLKCNGIDNINVYNESGFSKNQSIDEPYILDCGYCKKDEVLTVEIPIAATKETGYIECYAAGLNMDVFKTGYQILNQNTMNISDYEETYIKGTVNMPSGDMLYTSINYDKGWTVTVDGVKTNTEKIGGALIGVYVPEGEHTVEFKYQPQGLILGAGISAITAAAVIAYLIFLYIFKNKNIKSGKPKFAAAPEPVPVIKTPKGIEAMMAEDLGEDATVEDAEALIDQSKITDENETDNAPTFYRADDLPSVEKFAKKDSKDDLDKAQDESSNDENS